MRSLLPPAAALLLLAACGPRFEPMPPPVGGYATLVPNRNVTVKTARGIDVVLPAGTSLVGNGTMAGQVVYCGPVYVGGISERLCLAQRDENCFSADTTGPLTCVPRGSFSEQFTRQTPASEVADEEGLGFND